MWWVLNLTQSSVIYYVPVITCRHLIFVCFFFLQGFCCVWNSCFSWDMRWLALLDTRSEMDAMQGLLNGCATNADCRLADWQVNDQVNIVVICANRFFIPETSLFEDLNFRDMESIRAFRNNVYPVHLPVWKSAVCVCCTPLINCSSSNRWFWFFLYSFKPNTIFSFLFSDLDIVIHPPEGDPPATWWDDECDKSLLVGVYKYGEYQTF